MSTLATTNPATLHERYVHPTSPCQQPLDTPSERATAVADLCCQEELFRLTFEEAAVGLAHVGLDGTWLRVNRALCQILGYTSEELLDCAFQNLTHADDLAEDLMYVEELLQNKRRSYSMRKRYRRADGKTIWAQLTVSLIRNQLGAPLCFISVVQEISQVVATEEALRRSEEQHRHVVEAQTDLICRYTPDLRLTFVNEPYAAMRGQSYLELIGQDLVAGLAAEDQTAIQDNIASLSAANPTVSHENPWRLPDGTLRWFHWTDRVLLDSEGNICEYQGVGRDITERKVAEAIDREQRLLAEKEQIEAILNHSPNAKFLLDNELRIQRTNQVVQTLFACDPAACVSRSLLELMVPEDTPRIRQIVQQIPITQSIHAIEIVALRRDGTAFPAEMSIGRMSNGYVCTLSDTTERKEHERILHYHASLQEHVSDAVIAKDSTMCIQSWNRAAESIYGWRAEEVIGRPIHEVIVTEESAEERDRSQKLLYEQGWWRGEVIQRRKDGKRLHVLRSVTVLKDRRGQPYGVVTVNHDVSAMYVAMEKEKELVKLRSRMATIERERELTELKQRFVYMASHEFRTPIATIYALTETLSAYRTRMDDAQIDSRLEKIRTQSNYLTAMVEDVLHLATLEARRSEFHPKFVDLGALCASIVTDFQNGAVCVQTVTFDCRAAAASVAVTPVPLDEKLMGRVLGNLLSNAAKYSPADSMIKVLVEFYTDTVVISVQDEGIGIPAAEVKHLFEPFHRAKNAETIHGTGLGLTIVKEAVDLHNGTIAVNSELNVGTTFRVQLPRS